MSRISKKLDKLNDYLIENWVLPFALIVTIILLILWMSGSFRNEAEAETTTEIITRERTSTVEETTEPATTDVVEPTDPNTDYAFRVEVSDEDIALMARVVMSEASTESYDCKVAIAEVIINRLLSDKFPNSISKVIYQSNQFSTQNNGAVTDECYTAVVEALTNQRHPSDLYYFRADKWHRFGVKYMKIDSTYFSRAERS